MSTSAAPPGPLRRSWRELLVAAAVSAAVLLVYLWTRSHSIAGLLPPDVAPPRLPDETHIVEYTSRALAWPRVHALAAWCGAAGVGLAYLASRLVASRPVAVAAAVALGFGRTYWEQALLPGLPSGMALETSTAVPLVQAARWVFIELNAVGIALALVGTVWALRTAGRGRVLLAGAAALTFLAAVLPAPSPHAALVPVYLATTPLVAAGAAAVLRWLHSRVATIALVCLLPLVPLGSNFRHATAEPDTVSRWHLDAVIGPAGSCVVVGQPDEGMLNPELPQRVTFGGHTTVSVACETLVLPGARVVYEHLGYRFARVEHQGPTIQAYERMLPGGTVTALAVPAALASHVSNGVRVIRSDRLERSDTSVGPALPSSSAPATLARGSVGGTYPVMTVTAASQADDAFIQVDGRDIVRTRSVPAYAAFDPTGRPLTITALEGPPWRIPFDRERFGLSRHLAWQRPSCAELPRGAWRDVSQLSLEGRVGILSGGRSGRVVFYAARDRPLHPWRVRTWGGQAAFSLGRPDLAGLPGAAARDALPIRDLSGFDAISRIELRTAPGSEATLVSLDFGGIPTRVLARADAGARVCGAPRGDGFFVDETTGVEHINGRPSFFGDGWGPAERRDGRDWRSLVAREGELLVSLARTAPLRVVVTAASAADGEIALRINGRVVEPQHTSAATTDYAWTPPGDVWKTGVNQVFVTGPVGLRIADLQLARTDR